MTEIPKREHYYLKDGVFKLKSKWSKRFKIGFIIGILIGAVVPLTTSSHVRVGSYGELKAATKESALIEYITTQNAKVSYKEATAIVNSVMKWSNEFSISPELITAVMKQESNFERYAISSSGALGLMQVMSGIHFKKMVKAKQELGNPEPFSLDTNIFMGTWVLKDCLTSYKFESKALLCYNGSIGGSNNYDGKVLSHYKHIVNYVKENT